MSECKKTCGNCAGRIESILSKDRCDMTNKPIENYSSTCKDWEPNRETEIVMQKYELKSLRQERDELQAQVAVLRGALEFYAAEETHNAHELYGRNGGYSDPAIIFDEGERARKSLSTTPAEAAERVQKLAELLQDAVSETENGERLSKGFCSAAKASLSEWRRDKCSS